MKGGAGVGRWLFVAAALTAVGGFAVFGRDVASWQSLKRTQAAVQQRVDANPGAAVAAFVVGYVLLAALSVPAGAWLALLAGAVFGRWVGFAAASVAATLGATAAFLVSRHVLRDWLRTKLGDRLAAVDRGVERDGVYYLISLRLLPVVPYWLTNLAMGLTPMRVTTFAAASLVGMLPGTFLYVNAGTELATAESLADVLTWRRLAALATLAAFPLAAKWAAGRLPELFTNRQR